MYRDGRVAYWESGLPGKGKRRYERHEPGAPAEAHAEELRIRLRSVTKLGPKAWRTLDQAFQDMLIQKRSVKAEEGSIRQYKSNWNTWIPDEVGQTLCLEADLGTWTAIFDHANAEGATEPTIRSIGRTVGTLAKWGVSRRYFGPEPFGGILQRQVVLSEAKGVARVIAAELRKDYSVAMCPTVADVEKFAAAFEAVYPGYGERLVKLAFASGLRFNELLALVHDSIDFETNLISVDWQLDRYNHWPARKLPKYKKRRKAFLWTAYLDVARSLVDNSLARDPEDPEYRRLFPRHRSVVSWAEQAGELSGEAIKVGVDLLLAAPRLRVVLAPPRRPRGLRLRGRFGPGVARPREAKYYPRHVRCSRVERGRHREGPNSTATWIATSLGPSLHCDGGPATPGLR